MPAKRIVISGTGSGAGKTTVAIGVMAAFRQLGYSVQGFKCGPDYIDTTYHSAVTGRPAHNLDVWMCPEPVVRQIAAESAADADVSVIEGVMGLFDGKDPLSDEGSTAHIAVTIDSPVLLVVDCSGMARSAAAIVRGYQQFHPELHLCGIVANRVGSAGHAELIRQAVAQQCGIPLVGYLTTDEELTLPERHLGLVPAVERGELNAYFERVGRAVASCFDMELLLSLMNGNPLHDEGSQPHIDRTFSAVEPNVTIAVAKDEAFHFYYQYNLSLLERCGARLLYFSPLHGEPVPEEADGLYIGGGFPEEFASQLSIQHHVHESIRCAIKSGMPTLAECGGYMYLTDEIITRSGDTYPMAGVIPGTAAMQPKLTALGYREVTGTIHNPLLGPGMSARGHEYHYSRFIPRAELNSAYESKGMFGTALEGYAKGSLSAGYTHLHFASRPELAVQWVQQCAEYKRSKHLTQRR